MTPGPGRSRHQARTAHDARPGRLVTPGPAVCAACGLGPGLQRFRAAGLPPGSPEFRLAACPACGFAWTDPAVPDAEIGSWYPPSYYGRENVRFNPVFEALVRLFRWRRASVIAALAPPGSVLDVGCGRGRMLSHLRAKGFKPEGVELTQDAAWHAAERLGIPVKVGGFLSVPIEPGAYSAVIFWHSLEHMSRPAEALSKAAGALKNGGLLVVAVPNIESIQARLAGPLWFHLDIPRHCAHFGTRSLLAMLGRQGLEPVKVDHFCLEQNPYGWLQSLLNMLGFDYNFLYCFLLKNRSSRLIPVREHPVQALLTLALLPLLVPLALALTLLEAALRRGGTVEVYAVKKTRHPARSDI